MKISVNLSDILGVLILAGVAYAIYQQRKQRELNLSTNETLSTNLGALDTNLDDIKGLVTNIGGSVGNIAGDVTGLKNDNVALLEALAAAQVSPEIVALATSSVAKSEAIETALTDLAASAKAAADIIPDAPIVDPTEETPETPAEGTGETPETPTDPTDTTEPAPPSEEPAS